MARKSENKINGKIIGTFLGVALTLSILGAINLVAASPHGTGMAMHSTMHMMSGGMETEMTHIMDKDNDGLCDHCGGACGEMMEALG